MKFNGLPTLMGSVEINGIQIDSAKEMDLTVLIVALAVILVAGIITIFIEAAVIRKKKEEIYVSTGLALLTAAKAYTFNPSFGLELAMGLAICDLIVVIVVAVLGFYIAMLAKQARIDVILPVTGGSNPVELVSAAAGESKVRNVETEFVKTFHDDTPLLEEPEPEIIVELMEDQVDTRFLIGDSETVFPAAKTNAGVSGGVAGATKKPAGPRKPRGPKVTPVVVPVTTVRTIFSKDDIISFAEAVYLTEHCEPCGFTKDVINKVLSATYRDNQIATRLNETAKYVPVCDSYYVLGDTKHMFLKIYQVSEDRCFMLMEMSKALFAVASEEHENMYRCSSPKDKNWVAVVLDKSFTIDMIQNMITDTMAKYIDIPGYVPVTKGSSAQVADDDEEEEEIITSKSRSAAGQEVVDAPKKKKTAKK